MGKSTIKSITGDIEEKIQVSDKNIDSEDIKFIIDLFLNEIKQNIVDGNKIMLWKFGTFELKEFKERKAKDVNSGRIVIRPKKKLPKFKFSNTFLKKIK